MTTLFSVDQSLIGCVRSSQGLTYYESIKAVIRNDLEHLHAVRLVSGGGSGHEPAQVGYVGKGMLSGAVCGDLFSSPNVSSILATIKLMGPTGTDVLLIVTNYTGDRLNFGLAAEMAKESYNVRMLLVDDDCAIDNPRRSVGRRGLAGTILMHKICGAMAEKGKTLDDIYLFTNQILETGKLRTVGFSFDLQGEHMNVEIGRGVHGEPGLEKLSTKSFTDIIQILLQKLRNSNNDVVLLFNNLGGTSELLFNMFIETFLSAASYNVRRVLKGSFFTSLSTQGMSVTVLEATAEILTYIDAPVQCNASFKPVIPDSKIEPAPYVRKRLLPQPCIKSTFEKKALRKICTTLMENKDKLNEMDAEFGDGDTGTLSYLATETIAAQLDELEYTNRSTILHSLSQILLKTIGGSFGAVLCLFLQGAAEALDWYEAVKNGIRVIQRYTLVEEGDRTVVDVLLALEDQLGKAEKGDDVEEILENLVKAADVAVENTRYMVPKSGRAAYTFSAGRDFEAKFPDPGAQVAALIIKAIYDTYLAES